MKKILVIVGPTAVGKTSLALRLAEKFSGELISADSRQVYKDFDIGTGKDKDQVGLILGYDLVEPNEKYSVSDYVTYARVAIRKIWKKGKLPILVGGTGFYVKALTQGIETLGVPRDEKFRKSLEKLGRDYLYKMLLEFDPIKAASLNSSDRKNPRRLIRALEVAKSRKKIKKTKFPAETLTIGLKAPVKVLDKKISLRVEQRIKKGMEKEVGGLLKKGISWEDQSMSSLGYGVWKEYFEGKISAAQVKEKWIISEKRYARRQMTWFAKQKHVNWFDITDNNYAKKVERLVQGWYKRS